MTILGISIGTSDTGVCILKDDVLLDRRIHEFRKVWSEAKLQRILSRYRHYVHKFGVTAIVVKISPLAKHTPAVRLLLKKLERLAGENGTLFDYVTKQELKDVTGMRNTGELIDYTRRLYPELNLLYDRGAPSRHNYNKKLFEAVLSAHVFRERQRVRALQIERSMDY